jgi:hypothetical protein
VLVDDREKRAEVRGWILGELETVFDHEGNLHSFVEERKRQDAAGKQLAPYLRARTDMTSRYTDPATDTTKDVQGIILGVQKSVLRTDGVIAEALLGQGEALDEYATKLQDIEVDRRRGEAARLTAEAQRSELINKLAAEGDSEKAKVLAELTCPCGAPQADGTDKPA